MAIPKGWDPSSLGLVRKGDNPGDERFTPVEFDGRIIWALHPKYFNESTLNEVFQPYKDSGITVINNDEVFVKNISIRDVKTNNHSTSVNRYFAPVYGGRNFMNKDGLTPYEFALVLEEINIDASKIEALFDWVMGQDFSGLSREEVLRLSWEYVIEKDNESYPLHIQEAFKKVKGFEPWRLNYTPTLFQDGEPVTDIEIDIRDIPDIDLNSGDSITINLGDGNSISYPLPNILSAIDEGHHILKIKVESKHMHGFWYTAEFGGRTIQGRYSFELAQKAIISDYKEHMLKNVNREIMIHIDRFYNTAKNVLQSIDFAPKLGKDGAPVVDGTEVVLGNAKTIDALGGITAVTDAFMDFAGRHVMFSDMKNSSSNIGGAVVTDAVDEVVDMFVEITYPIAEQYTTNDNKVITPSTFATNEIHTYELNTKFNGMNEIVNYVNTNFPGSIVGMDVEIVFEYGRYSEYFNKLINKGVMVDGT